MGKGPVDRKTGPFQDWSEDDAQAELWLPLPPGTVKKDLIVVITAEKIHIKHICDDQMLLHAEPLRGPVVAEESTWYLAKDDVLNIVLAKQWRGETKSDQYWGAELGGHVWCYMSSGDVYRNRKAREKREKEEETKRLARVKTQRDALVQRERAEREEEKASEAQRRKAMERTLGADDDDCTTRRQPSAKRPSPGGGASWATLLMTGFGFLLLVELAGRWREVSAILGRTMAPSGGQQQEQRWYDEEQ